MFSGPDVAGSRSFWIKCRASIKSVICCRPVVVTFEEFKDREEVLRKAGLLKGSNIHVTEDMSRKVEMIHYVNKWPKPPNFIPSFENVL